MRETRGLQRATQGPFRLLEFILTLLSFCTFLSLGPGSPVTRLKSVPVLGKKPHMSALETSEDRSFNKTFHHELLLPCLVSKNQAFSVLLLNFEAKQIKRVSVWPLRMAGYK